MNTRERPKPAADLVVWGVVLGAIALALLAWGAAVAEPVSSYSRDDGPAVLAVFGWLVAAPALVCMTVGVYRLVAHADRASLLAYERSEERRTRDNDRSNAGPGDAPRSDVGAQ